MPGVCWSQVHNPLYGAWKKIYKKVLNVKQAGCLNGPRDIGATIEG